MSRVVIRFSTAEIDRAIEVIAINDSDEVVVHRNTFSDDMSIVEILGEINHSFHSAHLLTLELQDMGR